MSASDAESDVKDVEHLLKGLSVEDDSSGGFADKLKNLNCPFSWDLAKYPPQVRDVLETTEDKLTRGDVGDESKQAEDWSKVVYCLILCHGYGKKELWKEASEYLKSCEDNVENLSKDSDAMWSGIGAGLKHVIKATECFLKAETQKREEAEEMLAEIIPLDQLQSEHQAVVWGLRSAVSMSYGFEGMEDAAKYIEKAIKLDEKSGHWSFLKGKVLGRLRRVKSSAAPGEEELKSLERAVELTKCPFVCLYLAQCYREAARGEERYDSGESQLNKKSKALYKKALSEAGSNAHVNVRCAVGFMKLPFPYKDFAEAHKCINKGLFLAPESPLVNHAAGTFHRMKKNFNTAKTYLSKAAELGNHSAFFELIMLKYIRDRRYDPLPELQRMLSVFKEKPVQHKVRCEMASYLYSIKRDFKQALTHWAPIIEDDPESDNLKVHKRTYGHPSVYDVRPTIKTEIRQHLKGASADDKQQMKSLLARLEKVEPQL